MDHYNTHTLNLKYNNYLKFVLLACRQSRHTTLMNYLFKQAGALQAILGLIMAENPFCCSNYSIRSGPVMTARPIELSVFHLLIGAPAN